MVTWADVLDQNFIGSLNVNEVFRLKSTIYCDHMDTTFFESLVHVYMCTDSQNVPNVAWKFCA